MTDLKLSFKINYLSEVSLVFGLVVDAGVAAVLPPGGVTGGRGGLDVAQVLRDVNSVHYRSIVYPRLPIFSLASSV